MNIFDIICLAILVFMAFRGLFRGSVNELFGGGALVGGIIGAILWGKGFSRFIAERSSIQFSGLIAHVVLFIVGYVVIKILGGVVHSFVQDRENLVSLDRAMGFFVGLLEGVIIIVLILSLLLFQPFIRMDDLLKESLSYNIFSFIIPSILNRFSTLTDYV